MKDGLPRLQIKRQWLFCGPTGIFKGPAEYEVSCYGDEGDMIAIGFMNGVMYHFNVDRKVLMEGCTVHTGIPCISRSLLVPTDSRTEY